jgi:excisionase family DNA binding protein
MAEITELKQAIDKLIVKLEEVARPKMLLTYEEAAEFLGYSQRTVYDLVRNGKLPAKRCGRLVRIPYDSLRNWANEGTDHQASRHGGVG